MCRKIVVLCLAIWLMLCASCPVFARDLYLEETSSLTVTLVEQKQQEPIVGAELSIYHVAAVTMDADGDLSYDYTADFEGFGTSLEDASLASKLNAFLPQENIPVRTMVTDAQGTATCEDLPLGLYFIKQTGAVEGFASCAPFLVTVPGEDADGYVYDVNATPKTDVARLTSITIKKVWNTDASTPATDRITVQLLRDGVVIETAVLSAENDWQVVYEDMPESDAYSIKEVEVPKGFTATYQQSGYVFTVTNTATLPQTGQLTWPIPVLALGGTLLLALGIVLLQKKRDRHA